MRKKTLLNCILICICMFVIPIISEAAEPSFENLHVATCGSDSMVIKADHSLWFFGSDGDDSYLTPVKIMDNVKKVTMSDMSTTYGAYMPTYLILTYDGGLYIGGVCRYCPFPISDNIGLLSPEKIWDDVRDIDSPSGYGNYRFVENNGDMRVYGMGELQEVVNIGDMTIDEYYKTEQPETYSSHMNWIKKYWWDIDNLAEEDISAGFYIFVKNDGSVWTGVNCPADYKWYHGFIMGDGTERIESYNTNVYKEPVQIMPAGTCWSNISVVMNGKKLDFDVQPTIINGRTMVPMRAIFEALGASVEWDDITKTVTSINDQTTIRMIIDDKNMYVNNQAIELDVPSCIIDGRTLVPARAISEAYGAEVGWDAETSTVTIDTND